MKLIEEKVLHVSAGFCQNLSAKQNCFISRRKSEFDLMIFTQSLPCRQIGRILFYSAYRASNEIVNYVLTISASGIVFGMLSMVNYRDQIFTNINHKINIPIVEIISKRYYY